LPAPRRIISNERDPAHQLRLINLVVLSLPPAHQDTLLHLVRVLAEIARNSEINKMDAEYACMLGSCGLGAVVLKLHAAYAWPRTLTMAIVNPLAAI
jgi:hypothetical protein